MVVRVFQTWSWAGFFHRLGWVGLSQTLSLPSLYCESLLANCRPTSSGEQLHHIMYACVGLLF